MAILSACFLNLTVHSQDTFATRSEIRAFIDYTPIESYIINGYTYISVDDLTNYGFDVTFDSSTMSLNVTRKKFAYPIYTKEQWKNSLLMKVSAPVSDSSVFVYLDGEKTDSFYADGKTLIMIDALHKYGTFEWNNYSKEISITIFQDELQKEFDSAPDKVEINIQPREYTNENSHYIGQVDENNEPHGIGLLSGAEMLANFQYLGYFSNGKPNGLIFKKTYYTISRSYTVRETYFIGKVDGSKNPLKEIINNKVYSPSQMIKEPNFGPIMLPKTEIFWGIPFELPTDETMYSKGCYLEKINGKKGNYEFRIYGNGNERLNVFEINSGYDAYNTYDTLIMNSPEDYHRFSYFREYIDNTEVYSEDAFYTRTKTDNPNNPVILNAPEKIAGKTPNIIRITLNGEFLDLTMYPTQENNRTLVPIRTIADALNSHINWDTSTQTASFSTDTEEKVTLQIDNPIMTVGNKEISLEIPPRLICDRTFVPVRAILEAFNVTVDWDENLKIVHLTTNN